MRSTTKQTKAEIKAELMRQIGRGQQMITGAEFEYGIGRTIDLETFDARRAEGNTLIMDALDRADAAHVRLPY